MKTRIFISVVLASLVACFAFYKEWGSQTDPQIIARVRSEVATILGKDSARIGVAKPLRDQGADDLDIVEIVMALEEAFGIEIPDSVLCSNTGELDKNLTVQKLAKIVSARRKTTR